MTEVQKSMLAGEWQDAPDLTEEERKILDRLKADALALSAIPDEQKTPFANPDKFFGPIGFLEGGLPSGGVTRRAPMPRQQYTFDGAEIAALLLEIDAAPRAPDDDAAPSDQALATARGELMARGLVTRQGLVPALAAALQAMTQPQALVIARVSRTEQPPRQYILSQRESSAVVNWVGAEGRHFIDLYDSAEVSSGFWRYTAYDLNEVGLTPPQRPVSAQSAVQSAVYAVALSGNNLVEKRISAFGWFVGEGTLWLLRSGRPGADAFPEPTTLETLEALARQYCESVIQGATTRQSIQV